MTAAEWQRYDDSGQHGQHVAVAFVEHTDGVVYTVMRSSAAPEGTVLVFTSAEWDAFTQGILAGEFDRAEHPVCHPGHPGTT
ncbi:MAG: DUF397 domain-containing protein [Pseudonocardiaceae bacterium]